MAFHRWQCWLNGASAGRLLAALLVALAIAPRIALAADSGSRKPAVLFVGCQSPQTCQLRTWDDWLDSGFEIALLPLAQATRLDVLRHFNVVVVEFVPEIDARGNPQPVQLDFEKVMGQYLDQGGGVVILAGGGQWGRTTPALDHLLEPYGATVPEEQVVDPGHVVRWVGTGPTKLAVAETRDIDAAPMTKGVSRIAYIAQTVRADAIKMTQPVVLEARSPWQVIARGGPTSFSAIAVQSGHNVELRKAPTDESGPPILAVARSVGRGRLFLMPQNVAPTIASPAVFDSYLWNPRDQVEPGVPQNRTFIMQAVRWAAQPSLAEGTMGGYRTDPRSQPERRYILAPAPPIDWANAPRGARIAPALGAIRGLIGAQSTFSGAPHTVAELSAAARSAGLDFLAFTERLDHLDSRSWARLEAACREASTAGFLAIPGIEAENQVGDRYVALGWGDFPRPPAITSDGKRIDQTYRFWATSFGGRFVATTDLGENPNPWYEMKQVSAMAVSTVRGSHHDDATDDFLRSSYDMENYLPIAVANLTDPQQIRSAASGLVNVFGGPSPEALHDYVTGEGRFAGRDMFWEAPHPWYLSSGPRLAFDGGIRLGSLGVNEEAENTYRYGFRITGLQRGDTVLLMDGPDVYRKWIAEGGTFSTEHTWPHEQVRALVVRVVRNGQTILLSSPATLQWSRRFNQSADRQNTIPYNYEPDAGGDWYVAGAPIAPKYKAWPPTTLVYGAAKAFEASAVGVEYTPIQGMTWTNAPDVPMQGARRARPASLASYQHQRLSCPGIIVVDEVTTRIHPDGGQHGPDSAPLQRTEPLLDFEVLQRRYGIYGALGQLNGQLVESRIRALADVTLRRQDPLVAVSTFNLRTDPSMFAETRLGGVVQRDPLAGHEDVRREGRTIVGDYMGVYPFGLPGGGAQYAVAGSLVARLHIDSSGGLLAQYLLRAPARWKAGQQFDYSILYTTGASLPDRSHSDYVNAASFLGLDGSFPAIEKVTGGTLLPEPVIATIQARPEDVVRLATRFETDAPLGLPIRLRGFNPNWQVVYTLDGSKHWRYMGELDGDFYFHLYTQQRAHSVVAGQPLLADQPGLRITLDDPLGRQGAFELYNPTGQPMRAHLHTNPAFFPARQFDVTIPPYTSLNLRVDGTD